MMRTVVLVAVMAAAALAGCGGGGGGGTTPPTMVPRGTVRADTNRPGLARFTPNVTGANSVGSTIQIYAEERTGSLSDYTLSRRLTLSLYGPLTVGQSLPVNTTTASGTAYATYIVTEKNSSGQYVSSAPWRGTSGQVVITALDSAHVEGRFTATVASGTNRITFENGVFNLGFETPPPPPPSS